MRTGKQYLEALRDNRCVYMNGEKVDDVTTHPAFKGISETLAKLYDFSNDENNDMTYITEDGTTANKIFMIPRSREDLAIRREAITKWAETTYGMVGRSPDHVASFLAGFSSWGEIFEKEERNYRENVDNFYKYVRDNDLYLSYAIIPPQIDRSKSSHELDEKFLAMGVYEEREDGIVIRGSQMLGTAAAVADYMFISCITPLRPGDEDYAVSFAVPCNAPGLKFYTRPSYAMGKSSTYDYPLSTQYDESDALLVFDDVFIPWDQVFVYKDIDLARSQFFESPAHVLGNTQAQTRLMTKLKFIIGLAKKITEMNGVAKLPPVQEKLGELATLVATTEGLLLAAEYNCEIDKNGVARPHPRYLYGAMGQQNTLYPKVIQIVRELVGGGVLQVPSSFHELVNDETKGDVEKYIRSSSVDAVEKVKLYKLAWDIIGTEFGGRHLQYELFYGGAPFVVKGYAYRNYGFNEAEALVDNCLQSYGLPVAELNK
ncbi:4-hydroxyphenylacetate 3-hydroxylase family protein [Alkalihalobacterium alkalinitrilicum]|uniref:4-hydroxyphenylacetate 3-hydroxylase family protein n=1 Tax=Alkalihalobacterium alkalinitrilicum TaxID=427920 RepID=UPI0009957392|nr:4-hydroxyphenylacetate 3-hydroxylase N-terminal domain-containing protein [Alkalihalobacterium alkalinitrilicum]